jgi:hypothetical protein
LLFTAASANYFIAMASPALAKLYQSTPHALAFPNVAESETGSAKLVAISKGPTSQAA